MEAFRIFIVEDDPWYASLLEYHLGRNPDYEISKFASAKECLGNLHLKPAVITVDYSLPDLRGDQLLKRIHRQDPSIAVIIISGQEDITTAIGLIKDGAYDYIVKDEDTQDRLWNTMRLLRENLTLREENQKLRDEVGRKYDYSRTIIGDSEGIRRVFSLVEKAVTSSITVSITGETGSGKELVAKAIHYHSERRKHPFVAINVGAIPRDLVESELFGHEKGAFTGAVTRKTGVFEEANKGTLFLDEISEMDLNLQTRLLRVLQEREVRRVGGNEEVKVDVRVITATHKNLIEEVSQGNFRADLFYRLMGLPIQIPPLRERGNDIILLAKHFAGSYCQENKRPEVTFSKEASKKLLGYHYPGNVRELRAIVELSVLLCENNKVEASDISFNPLGQTAEIPVLEETLENHVIRIIRHYLEKNDHNPAVVARKLGIGRSTVYRYIAKYHL